MAGNANSGRRPKPITLRALEGSNKRPLPLTPQPEPGPPECPDWLSPLARAEWDYIVGLMARVPG